MVFECKLILPGELSKHAETEANKAVNMLNKLYIN